MTKASLSDHREIRYGIALQPFFCTGLPRSRTAWLANLFTTDTTLCYHDQKFDIGMVNDGKRVGFSGPEVCTQFTEVTRFFPNAPWLIVLREQSEALQALNNVLPVGEVCTVPLDFWQGRCHLISALCAKHQSMTVNFTDLDNESVMRNIWAHLLPGIPFDSDRYQMLCKLKVEQKI